MTLITSKRQIAKVATYGSDSAERRVARVINSGWPVLESYTHTDAARQLLAQRDIEGLVRGMPWDDFVRDVGGVVDPMARQVANSIRDEMRNYQGMGAALEFGVIDDLSVRYAQTQSGKLIVGLQESQRAAVREVMGKAMMGEYTVDSAARRIRGTIGLHPRWADAVDKFHDRQLSSMLKDGVPLGRATETAAKRTKRYHDSLVRKRSMMVARTEIHISSSLGRFATHRTAVENGYAATDSRKEWSAGPGACEICSGMAGEITLWDEAYSNGELIAHGHPGCRCADVHLPPEYGDAELDPQPINWLDDGTGTGAMGTSRFGPGGLTNGVTPVADVVTSSPHAIARESIAQAATVADMGTSMKRLLGDDVVVYGFDTNPDLDGFDSKKLDVERTRGAMQKVIDLMEKYPDVKAGVAIKKIKDNKTLAQASAFPRKDGTYGGLSLQINQSKLKKTSKVNETFENMWRTGHIHLTKTDTDPMDYTVAHEFGHLIDYTIHGKGALNPFAIHEELIRGAGISNIYGVEAYDWKKKNISKYGKTSRAEGIAEAFADVEINGNEAFELSKAIHTKMLEELRRANS